MSPEFDRGAAVAAYKAVLKRVVDNRPSGTRHRLAIALGTNRSFVSQITNPAYAVPVPAGHVDTILEVCHFTATERAEFYAAYFVAHPRSAGPPVAAAGTRTLVLTLPDRGDPRANRRVDDAIREIARQIARLAETDPDDSPSPTERPRP
ncbi:MAG: hypothetical protein MUF30_10505 [Burkholderiales bacterium]|jgi:hypothetical protein|nr:hypothetical protein [Burkholderiales bacterium]